MLEKLKAGEALSAAETRVRDDAHVLILKERHEELDAAVAQAYGWPVDLREEDILARLVDLNKQRAAEEAKGHVRWLRPDYQIPRFGTEAERARLDAERRAAAEAAGGRARQVSLDLDDDLQDMKPRFPVGDELAETAAVMRVLATAPAPLSIAATARTFSQGLKVEKRLALSILALARLVHLASPDGGHTFLLRRAG